MAWVATAVIATTAITAYGQASAGEAAEDSAEAEAAWMRRMAGVRRAESQREAIYERRRAEFAQSRVQAVAAASGAGGSDVTVQNIMADIEAEGEFRALSQLFAGEDEALGLEYGADVTRKEGKAARKAGYLTAAGTIFGGVYDWQTRSKKPSDGFYGPPTGGSGG